MSHISVLLHETVDGVLAGRDTGIYVDATFGRGGHTKLLLSKLDQNARVYAFDKDPQALEVAAQLEQEDPRFKIIHASFADLQSELANIGITEVDGVMADLGVSSPQLDQAERGFSFMQNGPLDMRMDQTVGQTAAEFIAEATEQKLAEVIKTYGEERFAKQIARAIVAQRAGGNAIATTKQLAKIVADAIPKIEPGQDPATRTFQALRIYLNQELEELSLVLPQCLKVLAPEGRLAVISFHSLEDRIVKQFVRAEQDRDDLPANFPVRAKDLPQPRMKAVGKAIKPSAEEVKRNPRSRSAVLRVAERTHVAL